MTATPDSAPARPASTFQVTHFVRVSPAAHSWSQSQSGELSAADAAAWIAHQAGEAADLGFADGPAEQPADPTVSPAVDVTPRPADGTPTASADVPQLGDS